MCNIFPLTFKALLVKLRMAYPDSAVKTASLQFCSSHGSASSLARANKVSIRSSGRDIFIASR